ncbi:siderophore synthetase component [Paenibacillus shirakamiensis]|uniref:Siderophore synthetase component n=1 Tax=Paenibacillus shirakamiensis TaxID=1265935 RepID=A0ABS4JE15_9BACL|nr:IucA/IucC family protein [Paenibacillus shirakamiensis]MBP1999968.1 siderophore synthetase component [Paenibacillus shirakamiensis]
MDTTRTTLIDQMDIDSPDGMYALAITSDHYIAARRRIFKQLVESLLYENIVISACSDTNEYSVWEILGTATDGSAVTYTCKGRRHVTFGRIRLFTEPISRTISSQLRGDQSCTISAEKTEAISIALFLIEVGANAGIDEVQVVQFITELEQTLINDTLARYIRAERHIEVQNVQDEDWESVVIEGHPYHPSYKSRIGFDIHDQIDYGPEFAQWIRPIWLGVHKSKARISHSLHQHSPSSNEWLREHLGESVLSHFYSILHKREMDPAAYVLLPVHPWQWRTTLSSVLASDIQNGTIVLLGSSEDKFTAQQSIRTLAHRTHPHLPYVKLSLSILNTSTGRILAPHTVENAPRLTDWMQGILKKDVYFQKELRTVLLGEVAGVAYDNSHRPEPVKSLSYGVLSCIWRESIHPYLEPHESSIPFNALTTMDVNGLPIIEPWVRQQGVEHWLYDLLNTSVRPLIHWLFAHGIALESHAQNMLLIHQSGIPTRIALKDFHDGIRFSREWLAEPNLCPLLVESSAHHQKVNRNSFIETQEPSEVRDFMHDAFFFINLGELALFMHEHYEVAERTFWNHVRTIIHNYQLHFPEYQDRYKVYSLFAPKIGVEQLTKRRLFPDDRMHIHLVPNPLA